MEELVCCCPAPRVGSFLSALNTSLGTDIGQQVEKYFFGHKIFCPISVMPSMKEHLKAFLLHKFCLMSVNNNVLCIMKLISSKQLL
jgi:hypothetical protein